MTEASSSQEERNLGISKGKRRMPRELNPDIFLDEVRRKAMSDLNKTGLLRPRAFFYTLRKPPIHFDLDLERTDFTLEIMNIIAEQENPAFVITLIPTWVKKVDGEIEHPMGLVHIMERSRFQENDEGIFPAISLMMFSKEGRVISQIIPYQKAEKGVDFDYGSQCEMEFNERSKGVGLKHWGKERRA